MIRKYNAEDLAELLDVWYDPIQTTLLLETVPPGRGRLLTIGLVVVRFVAHVFTMSGLEFRLGGRAVTVSRF